MMMTEKKNVQCTWQERVIDLLDFLKQEGLSPDLLDGIREFNAQYPTPPELQNRIPQPRYHYYGKDVWEAAVAAILCGENLLLAGSKATGKNVLAENLAQVFARPAWDVSFHVNMDAASLIGMDTFEGGEVRFRPGPVYLCAKHGGFGVLDEINMAKNEALAVLHATLDFRRAIDVPGYERVEVDPAARFIGTMNYGYAGTRELNEALTSRFVVIQMPSIDQDGLVRLLSDEFPTLEKKYKEQFAQLFLDLQKKCENAEISEKALDLRGLLDALRLIRRGIGAGRALDLFGIGRVARIHEFLGVSLDAAVDLLDLIAHRKNASSFALAAQMRSILAMYSVGYLGSMCRSSRPPGHTSFVEAPPPMARMLHSSSMMQML